MKLYIIGNGFDLAHNLGTSYSDYKEFIRKNLARNYKWETILNFYPDDYEFWSDIEYNVCKINTDLYFELKKCFGFGLLDDLYRQIHKSFEKFILSVESAALSKKPIFRFAKDSLFLTFNYTSLLEDIYNIPKDRIIYVHNDISGPAIEILYNLENKTPCIIGHSFVEGDYAVSSNSALLKDREYLDYVNSTTKRSDDIIKKKHIVEFILKYKNMIEEVVFYGFSFSITDKAYVRMIYSILSNKPIKIFYKLKKKETQEQCISSLKNKIDLIGINPSNITFVNCDSTKDL